jgi:hypothetical protein
MQRYAIFFITVNALHVSGGFSAHRQELKNGYMQTLLAATGNGNAVNASEMRTLK